LLRAGEMKLVPAPPVFISVARPRFPQVHEVDETPVSSRWSEFFLRIEVYFGNRVSGNYPTACFDTQSRPRFAHRVGHDDSGWSARFRPLRTLCCVLKLKNLEDMIAIVDDLLDNSRKPRPSD
jgi:hypothetical protein